MQGLCHQANVIQRRGKKGLLPVFWNGDLETESDSPTRLLDSCKENKGSHEREEKREDGEDDDTVSLESLVSRVTGSESISVEDAMDDMMLLADLLQKSGRDPLMDLNEYYQKQGIPSIKANFREETVTCHRKQPPCWRVIFECPCTGERVSSCLPIVLFLENDDKLQMIEQSPASESISNNFLLGLRMHQGVPCWYQKVSAKRTTAIATLLQLGFYGKDFKTPVVASSIKEAQQMLCRLENTEPLTNDSIKMNGNEDQYPSWVDALYMMGVQTVDITYHETVGKESVIDYTLRHPISLACRLHVKTPWSAEVTGEAASTKSQALHNAVQLLRRRYGHHLVDDGAKKLDGDKIKRRLLLSDSSFAKFIQPTPDWACSTFRGDCNETCYLYELLLENKSGQLFVSEQMGLDPQYTTRVGILFPVDISAHLPCQEQQCHFVSSFLFNNPITSEEESVRITLCHRSIVQPWKSNSKGVSNSLRMMKEFNRRLMSWKQYGLVPRGQNCCDDPVAQETPDKIGRTYLIVPLKKRHFQTIGRDKENLSIDWNLIMQECYDNSYSFLNRTWRVWQVPVFGGIDAVSVAWIALFSACALTCQRIMIWIRSQGPWILLLDSSMEVVLATFFVFVALFSFILFLLPPIRRIPSEAMEKWFVLHRSQLYILQNNRDCKDTAYSSFPLATRPTKKRSYRTFNEYYRVRYGLEIKYPREYLLPALKVDKQTDHNPFLRAPPPMQKVLLIPEFTTVLPVPRDFLYFMGLTSSLLPAMERGITMSLYSAGLQSQLHALTSNSLPRFACGHLQLASTLNLATTTYPKSTYERLEFLGDAVLGYFLAIKVFLLSHSLDWHIEEFENMISNAGRNAELADAALRIGLPRLLHASKTIWQSAYCESSKLANNYQFVDVPDTILSDCVESCLGALYVSNSPCVVDDLLNRLHLPIVSSVSIFDAVTSSCIANGIQLDGQPRWQVQLARLHEKLNNSLPLQIKLSAGVKKLCNSLDINISQFTDCRFETSFMSLVLGCAVCNFSQDMGDTMTNTVEDQVVPEELVSKVRHFREILHQVGAFSLQLKISEEVFYMYDEADPNDLHFLRTAAITDDVSAYIFTKFKLHQALLVRHQYPFETHARLADLEGLDFWEERGGWLLPGGVGEFQVRMKMHFKGSKCEKLPRYPGLLAGRLFGHDTKLDKSLTNELVFSFKALIGALVLAMGLEATWKTVGPMYHELIVVSADELRNIASGSTIVRSYTKKSTTK